LRTAMRAWGESSKLTLQVGTGAWSVDGVRARTHCLVLGK
jgi:hypothetical protein